MISGFKAAGLPAVAIRHDDTVTHIIHSKLQSLSQSAGVTNIAPIIHACGVNMRLVTNAIISAAGLFVVSRSKHAIVTRPKTLLNAVCADSLLAALKIRGMSGAPLEKIYAEYPDACADIHGMPRSKVFCSRTHAWHAAVAGIANKGALERWRAYKAHQRKSGALPK